MRVHSIAVFLVLLTPFVQAQDELLLEDDSPEEIRRYAVEIVIFSYAEDVSVGTEVFIPDVIELEEPLPESDETPAFDDTSRPAADTTDEEEPDLTQERELQLVKLEEDELTLTEIVDRLERLDAYEPLMHFGWSQATWPEEETLPLELRTFAEPPPGLNGDLTLYLSRYLHLVVNLALDEKRNAATVEPDYSFTDDRMFGDSWLKAVDGPVRFRIQENRIIRNGEIRYFDHPKFGVLAKVTRIEEEESDDEFDDSLELLSG